MSEQRTPRYNDLKAIDGHKNYYRNPMSKKITYSRRGVRIATGLTQITKAKELVEQELAKLQGQTQSTAAKRIKAVSNPMIKDCWDVMIEEDKKPEAKPNTLKTYNKSWKVGIAPFWSPLFAADFNDENILAYKKWYLETHPKRQFKKTLIHFQVLAKAMLKRRVISKIPDLTPLASIDDTTHKNARRLKVGRRLRAEEISAIKAAAENYVDTEPGGQLSEHKELLGLRAQLGVAFGVDCGMRKMEGLSLPWEKVDFKGNVLHVWSTKNHEWREIPILPHIRSLLLRQQELTGHTAWVFPMPSDPSRHISGQIFDKVWIRIKGMAGIVGRCRYHDLRHTFASITADAGWSYKVACDILDMSLEMYDKVYAHPSLHKKAELMHQTFGVSA